METDPQSCPKCGYLREPGAAECPACGVIYARFEANAQRHAAPSENAAYSTAPAEINPYAPPRSNVAAASLTPSGPGIWRDGSTLVMEKRASLPQRCMTCNQPAQVRLTRKLYCHTPVLYLLIVIGILVYALIALVVRRKATLEIPLCLGHDERRKRGILTAWLICLTSLAILFGSFKNFEELWGLTLLGIFGFLIGLFVGSALGRPVLPKKINDTHVWLTKVSPDFLATLPQAPPGL